MSNDTTNVALAGLEAAVGAVATTNAAGAKPNTDLGLALSLASQGIAFWSNFAAQAAKGALTVGDMDAAAAMAGTSIDKLAADIDAAPLGG